MAKVWAGSQARVSRLEARPMATIQEAADVGAH